MRVKKDRTSGILELLSRQKKMEVTDLASALQVSKVTMRKDLDELESRGLIVREHGFASLRSAEDIGVRLAIHYDAKSKIARKAAELVEEGETIMIESGSCCTLLADILTKTYSNLTIITNSSFLANYIRNQSNFQIILLGGIFQQSSQVMVGPMIEQMVSNFSVDKFFIGTDGISISQGVTNSDQMRAQAVRDMSSHAEQVIVLTESEKFSKKGVVPLNLGDKIKTIITDEQPIEPELKEHLQNQGIEILQCPAKQPAA